MKIVGLPSDSRKLQAYFKLLGVFFPHTLKGTLGIWLSSQLSRGYYAIDGYSTIKENLPIQNLNTYVKCAFRVKPEESILGYTVDGESYVFVNCKSLDCKYKISRRNYEIRRVI